MSSPEIDGSQRSNSSNGKRSSGLKKRRSSLFASARASFYRSRGQSGASVETLRGSSGADFEGYAIVHRGSGDTLGATLLCCLGGGGGAKDGRYFLLIKGQHLFVFKDEEGKSPKYAVELIGRRAVLQPSHGPGAQSHAVVNLETGLGDLEYVFTFDITNRRDLGSSFVTAISTAAAEASTELARKRLGHEGLLTKRGSLRYAANIGEAKTKDAPEAPLSTGEVLAGMPTAPTYN